jgi:hypothetical protein
MSLIKKIKNQRGVVLLLTLLILSTILVVTLGAADLVLAGLKMNRLTGYSNIAFFASEAGMERALWEARTWEKRGAANPIPVVDQLNLFSASNIGNGSSYQVDFSRVIEGGKTYIKFQSIGSYSGVKRSVETKYEE